MQRNETAALIHLVWGETVKGLLVLIAVLATTLVFASAAAANSVSCAHSATPCSGGNGPTGGGGTLPFTGLDLAGITGIGVVLLGSGLALQRMSRRRQQ
jgi:hypothetical protein